MVRIRKGKRREEIVMEEKDVVHRTVTDFVDRAGCGVESEEESESVQDNDESDGRCKDWKYVGDYSVESGTELGSTSKPVVDVDETAGVSKSGNGVGNEKGNGNEDASSSEEGMGTEVSSSDSENVDDSDEDYNEHMADVSRSSESVSESDADLAEEFAPRERKGKKKVMGLSAMIMLSAIIKPLIRLLFWMTIAQSMELALMQNLLQKKYGWVELRRKKTLLCIIQTMKTH